MNSVSDVVSNFSRIEEGQGVSFSEAGLQLTFIDLMHRPTQGSSVQDQEVRSVRYLTLGDGAQTDEVVTFVKLLPNPAPTRRISSGADGAYAAEASEPVGKSLVLVVGTASGHTYFWDVDPTAAPGAAKVCMADGLCANPQLTEQKVSLMRFTVLAEASDKSGTPLAVAATAAFHSPAYTIVR